MLEIIQTTSDEEVQYSAFSSYMDSLLRNEVWRSGNISNKRIPWSEGLAARKQDIEIFNSFGIYIWGGIQAPIYVGKTTTSFKKRFSRYIWSKKSQCNLAKDYGSEIVENGVDGFPREIRDWYRKGYGNSLVRLNGAVRFAREGMDNIWFTLLPVDSESDVANIEKKLIRIAQQWNTKNGFSHLLNIEFNPQK
ncbi:hypothetical protein Q9F25_003665 [Vibrio cholerae]